MKKKKLKSVLKKIGKLIDSALDEDTEDYDEGRDGGDRADHGAFDPADLDAAALTARSSKKFAMRDAHKNGQSICVTDSRGHSQPGGRTRLVVDATEGFVPLWAHNMTLRWRINQPSLAYFRNPDAAGRALRHLFGAAVDAWGDAAPIRFKESNDLWDFEIYMMRYNDCDPGGGCVLASAFFPDGGRHRLKIFPKMFEQPRREWVETLVHEIGHVFGLRHFFAQVREGRWPSHIFGTHTPFSIMNYGPRSVLTETDKSDLKLLYNSAWTGQLTNINGTPIRLFRPYSNSGSLVHPSMVAAFQS